MPKTKKGRKRESSDEKPKSDALKDFEINLDALMAFLERLRSHELLDDTKALERVIKKETASAPQVNIKRLERGVKKYTAAIDKWTAFLSSSGSVDERNAGVIYRSIFGTGPSEPSSKEPTACESS